MIAQRFTYLTIILVLLLMVGCAGPRSAGHRLSPSLTASDRQDAVDSEQVRIFSRSVRPIQGEIDAKYKLARHFQRFRNHRIAIEVLKEIVRMDPAHAEAHNLLGYSYDCLGEFQTAQSHYKTAIALSPEMDHAYNNLGYSFLLDGQYAAAVKILKKAIALNDGNAKYNRNLELAYYRSGKVKEIPAVSSAIAKSAGTDTSLRPQEPDAGSQRAIMPTSSSSVAVSTPPRVKPDLSATAAKPIPEAAPDASIELLALESIAVTAKNPKGKIEVSNGNGVRKMAARVGDFLKSCGERVFRVTNAKHFNHKKTIIYYRTGHYHDALRIRTLLPGLSGEGNLVEIESGKEPLRVLIGSDLVPFRPYGIQRPAVEISNGNGVNGMARRVGEHLRREGYRVGRLANADRFTYESTVIYHSKGQDSFASVLADALPGSRPKRLVEIDHPGKYVRILLGTDMMF